MTSASTGRLGSFDRTQTKHTTPTSNMSIPSALRDPYRSHVTLSLFLRSGGDEEELYEKIDHALHEAPKHGWKVRIIDEYGTTAALFIHKKSKKRITRRYEMGDDT